MSEINKNLSGTIKARDKMPVSQRAKQFMPFAAVVGLEEALRRKEAEVDEKFKPNYTDNEEFTTQP